MTGKELSTANKAVIVAGVFLLFNLFNPWYKQGGFFGEGFGANAYDVGFLAWGGSWLGIVAATIVGVRNFGKKSDKVWPLSPELFALLLSAAGFVLILVRIIKETDQIWLGLILGLVAAAVETFAMLGAAGITISTAPRTTTPPPPPPAAG